MRRWAKAVALGVALSAETGANPLSLSLSPATPALDRGKDSNGRSGGNGLDVENVYVEYLSQCSGADLDRNRCLVARTIDIISSAMDGEVEEQHGARHRLLQDGDDCDPPTIDERDLRMIMSDARMQCEDEDEIADDEFEGTLASFVTLFGSEACFSDLCHVNPDEPSGLFLEILVDEAANCAAVELDLNPCLKDVFFGLFDDNHAHRDLRQLDSDSYCPSHYAVGMHVSMMLLEAEAQCAGSGVFVSQIEIDAAMSDLTALFHAQHCWGEEPECEEPPAHEHHRREDHGGEFLSQEAIYFEYLNRCSDAGLDRETCLVGKTVEILSSELGGGHDGRHRLLQRDDGTEGCAPPAFGEPFLRYIMGDVRTHCAELGDVVTDGDFENAATSLASLFDSEACFGQLCIEAEDPTGLFLEVLVDETSKCAGVDIHGLNTCLKDEFLGMMFGGEHGRRLLQDGHDKCEEGPSESEVAMFVSFSLLEAEARCTEQGRTVDSQDLGEATDQLTKLFLARRCFGDVPSDCDGGADDYHLEVATSADDSSDGGESSELQYFDILVSYVEECDGSFEMNTDDCLVRETIDFMTSMGGPSALKRFEHRLLQTMVHDGDNEDDDDVMDQCLPPEVSERDLRFLVGNSRSQCQSEGLAVSDDEFEATVGNFVRFFGAEGCWVDLCTGESIELMMKITFEHAAECAGIELDMDSCLMDQVFALMFASEDPGESYGQVRRKLQGMVIDDAPPPPCEEEQPDMSGLMFLSSMLVAGAHEQCMQLNEHVTPMALESTTVKLAKLFGAQSCWGGGGGDCEDHKSHEDVHHKDEHHVDSHVQYANFVAESHSWILGQCIGVEPSCLFDKSLHLIQKSRYRKNEPDIVCTPPSQLDGPELAAIVNAAGKMCARPHGGVLDPAAVDKTLVDIQTLASEPGCWRVLCEEETKDVVVEEWLHECADTDIGFLSSDDQTHPHRRHPHLDTDRLRCMVSYISAFHHHPHDTDGTKGGDWTCDLPVLGRDACAPVVEDGLGREAYLACGGELKDGETPSPTPQNHHTDIPTYQDDDVYFSFSYDYHYLPTDWPTMAPSHPEPPQSSLVPTALPSSTYPTALPSPPTVDLSMNYDAEGDDMFGWADPHMSMSLSMGLTAMPSGRRLDHKTGHTHAHVSLSSGSEDMGSAEVMYLHIAEVCDLIGELNSEKSRRCLDPVCDLGDGGVLDLWFGRDKGHYDDLVMPTMLPTHEEGNGGTLVPVSGMPSASPTMLPTLAPASRSPVSPTSSPTEFVKLISTVEVTFEVAIKLEGIQMSDLDVTSLDSVVDLLESVFQDLLPDGAKVRLLKVGGIAVSRRILRMESTRRLEGGELGDAPEEEEASSLGVDVEFEVILSKECSTLECEDSEEIASTMYDEVATEFQEKVDDGSLTEDIQEKAEAKGVPQLRDVTISANSLTVSEPKTTVRVTKDKRVRDDDDSDGAVKSGTLLSIILGVAVSALICG